MRSTIKQSSQPSDRAWSRQQFNQSEELSLLKSLFGNLNKPYGLAEIQKFNSAYQRIYPTLNQAERLQAELLVDAMIAGIENRELRCKIYGVV